MSDQVDSNSLGLRDPIGLCADCRHARLIHSSRGSTFYLCQLSETDPRFAKYPRLPMLQCAGYEAATATADKTSRLAPGEKVGKTGTPKKMGLRVSSHHTQVAHPATGGEMGKTGTTSSHQKTGTTSSHQKTGTTS